MTKGLRLKQHNSVVHKSNNILEMMNKGEDLETGSVEEKHNVGTKSLKNKNVFTNEENEQGTGQS